MTFGKELIQGLNDFADALESGDQISDKFTCHKIVLDLQPTPYDQKLVKETREILNVSQSIFAQFMGVSVKAVQSWESGTNPNPVNGAACRLLDEIRNNPEYFKARLRELAVSKPKKETEAV